MTPLEAKRISALEERVQALEVALVNAQRTGKIDDKPAPAPKPKPNGNGKANGKRPMNPNPRWLPRVRWSNPCGHCNLDIPAGDAPDGRVWYDPAEKAIYHDACAKHAPNPPGA